ncbi:hypothetical protein FAZ15_21515 [Sphingobacterium olei]|uniref:Lipoprotein n=1 Tax=Sphingobacterium olei TaxID=2571155 RepID=A0A4U0N9L2_9SPHI|nr:hypothetical protein [Sphingobacterium olei]TJZ50601.1 hypothetical protein FAZ15_21515 [Sphingobacterium olei]
MLKRFFFSSVTIMLIFSLSSCFDIVEEINFQSNGAGKIKATLNLSKSKTKVASLMLLDSVNGIKVPSKTTVQKELNDIVLILKQTKGVSNVNSSLDFNNYIATLECDFNNVAALNAFTKTLSTKFKTNISGYTTYAYDASNKVFVRKYNASQDAKKEFLKLKGENQKVFNDAYFTSIYRFVDPVKKQQNSKASISANRKAVMLKTGILDLINDNTNLSNTIVLN